MIGLQAEQHDLIDAHNFESINEYVLHLIHTYAYFQSSQISENKTVLDLGCNTGYGTEILSRSAKKITGVDVSEQAILKAKERYNHPTLEFQQIDGKHLPFEDNQFDLIVSFQVIEHIVDHYLYINELKRVLSPGGIVIFTTPNAYLRLDPGMKPWNNFHVREFNHAELENLLMTYFPVVKVIGLNANEPLYSIEASRLDRARQYARNKNSLLKRAFVKATSILNNPLYLTPAAQKKFISKHGLSDLFYGINDLEKALDLLAICTDDGNLLNEAINKIVKP
ncbi:MAG: class I SAM-dependent methyltransferase [Gammaproteobacteria bacterium]|nr:class I SAM-dependent methyltransferase [Gammaproteobacteria bacterium]